MRVSVVDGDQIRLLHVEVAARNRSRGLLGINALLYEHEHIVQPYIDNKRGIARNNKREVSTNDLPLLGTDVLGAASAEHLEKVIVLGIAMRFVEVLKIQIVKRAKYTMK